MQTANEAEHDALDTHAKAWLEKELDGAVLAMHRYARWRPNWKVEFRTRDGAIKPLYVRAPRGEGWINPVTFRQELGIHRVLERSGIPVPHFYDTVDDWGLVADYLDGEISVEVNSQEPERGVIYEEFVDALARLHAIPVERFREAGLYVPDDTPADIALNHYDRCYDIYLRQMRGRHVPVMDFTYAWMKRNVPLHRTRKTAVTGDAGQFMFRDGHLLALNDFEQFYIGDPIADFAGMRLRDILEPLDIDRIISLYEAKTGEFVDKYTLEYHSIGFNGVNGWLLWPTIVSADPEQDYMVYLTSAIGASRWILTSMAVIKRMTLPTISLPNVPRPLAPSMPYEHLQRTVDKLAGTGMNGQYNKVKASGLAQHLARWNDYGSWFIEEDLKALEAILGTRFGSVTEGHAALSQFVRTAGADRDEMLIHYFHGWLQRYDFLFAGCGPQSFVSGLQLKSPNVPWREAAR